MWRECGKDETIELSESRARVGTVGEKFAGTAPRLVSHHHQRVTDRFALQANPRSQDLVGIAPPETSFVYTSRPMAHVELHDLQSDKRAGELARLIETLAADGRRLIVWVADEGRRRIFDDWLWTFDKLAFVPHSVWQPSLGEVTDPVVLVGEPGNPNAATVLVIGDDLPPEDWARDFDEIHDLIAPGAEGEERRGWWERWRDSARDD